jgi:hypothetical protein
LGRSPVTSIDEVAAFATLPDSERATVYAWCDALEVPRAAWFTVPPLKLLVTHVALLRAVQEVRARYDDGVDAWACAVRRLDGRDRTATGIGSSAQRTIRRWRAAAQCVSDDLEDEDPLPAA